MSLSQGARVNYKTEKEIYLEKLFTGRIDATDAGNSATDQARFYRPKDNK